MSSSSIDTQVVDVVMPQMGVSVSEGTIVEWRKQAGDRVEYEEPLCDVSTDKIDTELPSPASGRITEIVVEVGTTVDVGAVLARIAADARPGESQPSAGGGGPEVAAEPAAAEGAAGEILATSEAAAATGQTPAGATPEPAPEPAAAVPDDAPQPATAAEQDAPALDRAPDGENGAPQLRRYTPVVMRMAAEHGIDLSKISGTGRGGRVRKKDVLTHLQEGAAEAPATEPPLHIESPYRPEPPAPRPPAAAPASAPVAAAREPAPAPAAAAAAAPTGRGEPLSRMRRSIGEHMKRSLETAAHCTTMVECDMSAVERRRSLIGTTALPIVARCVVEALREYPSLNAWLEGDTFTQHAAVHLGIAVSLGEDGLIVPVVRDAQDLSDEGLARHIKDLARRARDGELTPDDVRGGTFTITNPGQFGAVAATPIINQPQVAILDLEAIVKRPVVVVDADGNDAIAIRPMTMLCMSWDHRAIDGAVAAQFLTAVRRRVESV